MHISNYFHTWKIMGKTLSVKNEPYLVPGRTEVCSQRVNAAPWEAHRMFVVSFKPKNVVVVSILWCYLLLLYWKKDSVLVPIPSSFCSWQAPDFRGLVSTIALDRAVMKIRYRCVRIVHSSSGRQPQCRVKWWVPWSVDGSIHWFIPPSVVIPAGVFLSRPHGGFLFHPMIDRFSCSPHGFLFIFFYYVIVEFQGCGYP